MTTEIIITSSVAIVGGLNLLALRFSIKKINSFAKELASLLKHKNQQEVKNIGYDKEFTRISADYGKQYKALDKKIDDSIRESKRTHDLVIKIATKLDIE